MPLMPIWADPNHWVGSARLLLQGHGLRALAVVENGVFQGIVREHVLAKAGERELVGDFIEPLPFSVHPRQSPRQVAQEFVDRDLDVAPVIRDGKFLGLLTSNMLLRELGRSYDPHTGLSWSDYLRQWGTEQLRLGNELTILFIDLDDFKQYNTRYGHIVGDKVLRSVATFLGSMIDPENDVLVRYGGDEFAIGTIRTREIADELAEDLVAGASSVRINESVDPIQFTVGVFGGKRRGERDNVHFAATLDNLINLASRDALDRKARKKRAQAGSEEAAATPRTVKQPSAFSILSAEIEDLRDGSRATVSISFGDKVISGSKSIGDERPILAVAEAAQRALALSFNHPIVINDVMLFESNEGRQVRVIGSSLGRPCEALVRVQGDPYFAVAEATLQLHLSQ